jgi:hypothetical protein
MGNALAEHFQVWALTTSLDENLASGKKDSETVLGSNTKRVGSYQPRASPKSSGSGLCGIPLISETLKNILQPSRIR